MTLLKFLRAGPPPPRAVVLPDALFFARTAEIAPGATRAEAEAQAELALEALSPFPLAQLYYGYFWTPEASRALVYASYRRRFTVEQAETWTDAEYVWPAFVCALGAEVEPATTFLFAAPDGLTALHWEAIDGRTFPVAILHRPLAPEATDEDRARLRDELLRAIGESRKIVDIATPPAPEPQRNDREVVFRVGEFESRLPVEVAGALDVRDKKALAALRRSRARDLIFWRVAMGCAAACLLLVVGELGLQGGRLWQKSRLIKLNTQKPVVERTMQNQQLANRIEDLSTKRLLPLEMISVVAEKKPSAIQFLHTTTTGLYVLQVEATTNNAGEISRFKNDLEALASCEKVEVRDQRTRDNIASFTLIVTFKPGAIKPAGAISA